MRHNEWFLPTQHRHTYRAGFAGSIGNAIRLETRRIGDHPSIFLFSTWLGTDGHCFRMTRICELPSTMKHGKNISTLSRHLQHFQYYRRTLLSARVSHPQQNGWFLSFVNAVCSFIHSEYPSSGISLLSFHLGGPPKAFFWPPKGKIIPNCRLNLIFSFPF